MADLAALRIKMVDGQVRPSDVTDHRIIEAMLTVPRELFVPAGMAELAYLDRPPVVSTTARRGLLPPMLAARMLQAAEVTATDKVLVIGAGSGYLAVIAAHLAKSVVALEDDAELLAIAATATAGTANLTLQKGSLAAGHAAAAPYDVILIEGAARLLPPAVTSQLADGGRLAVIEGEGPAGRLMLHTLAAGRLSGRVIANASAPSLPGFQPEPAFEF